jgi:hypothetical protein
LSSFCLLGYQLCSNSPIDVWVCSKEEVLFILEYRLATKYLTAVCEAFCCVSYKEVVYEAKVFRCVTLLTYDTVCLVEEKLNLLFRKYLRILSTEIGPDQVVTQQLNS